jgi:hypothetical protein
VSNAEGSKPEIIFYFKEMGSIWAKFFRWKG